MSIKRKKENHLIIRIHDFILQPIYFILTIHSIINPLHPLIYQLYQRKVKKIPKTKFRDHVYNPCCFLKITGITRRFPLPKKTFFILCSFFSPPLRRQLLTMPVYSYPSSPDDGASTQRV